MNQRMNHFNILQIIFILLVNSSISFGQQISIPENYSILDTVSGDLDKDGINELVVAYNTKKENEEDIESIPRELIIYKNKNEQWTVWKKSEQALYGSKDGGMMGDPYGEMEIKNGTLLINQQGGSSWKWGHTDKYRYQDGEFYLIGYTSSNGKICEYWTSVDFNLSTGEIIVEQEYEDCETDEQKIYKLENETFYKKGLKITLEKRMEKEILIVSPKYKHEIYVSQSYE
jgi:hypothetical protein